MKDLTLAEKARKAIEEEGKIHPHERWDRMVKEGVIDSEGRVKYQTDEECWRENQTNKWISKWSPVDQMDLFDPWK